MTFFYKTKILFKQNTNKANSGKNSLIELHLCSKKHPNKWKAGHKLREDICFIYKVKNLYQNILTSFINLGKINNIIEKLVNINSHFKGKKGSMVNTYAKASSSSLGIRECKWKA